MRGPRWWITGATAVVVAAGTAVTGVASGDVGAAAAQAGPGGQTARTVTLVTGDRVTVFGGNGQVAVEAGPGRAGMTFTTTTEPGRVEVVPNDAVPLLAAGRLDERLFDVTGLLAAGYDGREHLPLILAAGKSARMADVAGLAKERDLPAIKGMAVRQPRAKAASSWRTLTSRSDVGKIWLDGLRRPTLDVSVPQVGAPAAWAAGYTGAGTTVAVLDTGVDAAHPDLAGQVTAQRNFTEGVEPDEDLVGHGTHVAATIAGTGAGKYRGVAPGSKLLDGKVCVIGGCAESWIIAGMTWAAAEQRAMVVNMSLGGDDDPEVIDPVEEAVQTLSDEYGTLFVVAAGNADGVTEGAIASPGTAPAALTVGAVDDKGAVASFSRRGPGPGGAVKPDIVAPGVGITAARGRDATRVPGDPGDPYTTLSGTSMATPHVAGAVALLSQQHPGWSGPRLKTALMAAARPNPAYGVYAQGAGHLDVARAAGQSVTAVTGSVSFGMQLWPHDDDQVLSREVTYRNDGLADVTLALAPDTSYPDGTPTPAGMFSVSSASIVVPAGGDATVTVTADTRVAGPDGYAGGWLTASAGDLIVRTPVAVHKEVESYDLTVTHLDRDGVAPPSFTTKVVGHDTVVSEAGWVGGGSDNTATKRVRAGHYTLISSVDTGDGSTSLLAQPDLHVDRSLTVTVDARTARPLSVTVPPASARQVYGYAGAFRMNGSRGSGRSVFGDSFEGLYTGQIGAGDDGFFSTVGGQWARADATGNTDDSPYLYTLFFPERGRMVTGYQRAVVDSELAKVRADFAAAQPGTTGEQRVRTSSADLGVGNGGPNLRFSLPFTRTEYYNTDPGVGSAGDFYEVFEGEWVDTVLESGYTQFQTGRPNHTTWNRGVFAHSLPPAGFLWPGAFRTGDTLTVDLPQIGDGAGRPGGTLTTVDATELFRDGTKVGDVAGSIDVPPGEATYRLERHTERGKPFALSTKIDTAWTFRSGHVDGDAPVVLPLWVVRFAPRLDQFNTAPAGRLYAVPMDIASQAGSVAGKPADRGVEVSFDDGATWAPVRLRGETALVAHPKGSGFVSLRARAADDKGNAVEQTVIHAYRYGSVR